MVKESLTVAEPTLSEIRRAVQTGVSPVASTVIAGRTPTDRKSTLKIVSDNLVTATPPAAVTLANALINVLASSVSVS